MSKRTVLLVALLVIGFAGWWRTATELDLVYELYEQHVREGVNEELRERLFALCEEGYVRFCPPFEDRQYFKYLEEKDRRAVGV